MRILLFVMICLLFNCEDKETSKQNTKPKQDKIETKTEVSKKPERQYPKLTDKNALQFLSEYGEEHNENKVRIVTDFGNIDILLYDKTKYHRANFIFLAEQNYFNYTQFYRVVPNFIIQGGSSDGMDIAKRRKKIGRYLLPPDTKKGYTHKRGAISMPSSEIENAYKLASPYQFFIVNRKGGAPFLDEGYTVFGEVIDGMDVVDEINAVETDEGEWPIKSVYIKTVEIIE
ncbi:peptidylprolyl isomerase [Winogradskyella jejuensis]|uniref:Peptidyl-prolyl cis-trans isomerase n=1 Tax=Winogradskyella jejuensis TaxID=1089305 RepID=A0A1M5JLY2_9FLAO|nr:peptidylprolyl isomerase [Winogradskyella jejuensis]SHG41582.1 Peptidyl-prolyl cis-trans isomerase (rotamase)-cyclophilin family [Winogradskyella jejuensis]